MHQSSDFPWHIGVYDAHCHPTDSMSRIEDISKMKARVLTIMATRLQDQHLVSEVAEAQGYRHSRRSTDDKERGLPKGGPEDAQEDSREGFPEKLREDLCDEPCRVIPSFGWHPWFSHQLYDDSNQIVEHPPSKKAHYSSVLTPKCDDDAFLNALPEPRRLSEFLSQTRLYLEQNPLALVGEIGLDKSFRIPDSSAPSRTDEHEPEMTPGSREGRRLSPYRVDAGHQVRVLKAQLDLAAEFKRPVSVHGVSAHGVLFDALASTWKGQEKAVVSRRTRKRRGSVDAAHAHEVDEEGNGESDEGNTDEYDAPRNGQHRLMPYPPRICLHSYSGPPEPLKQYLHPSVPVEVFFSFSKVINFSTAASARAAEVIKAVPADRILVESDLHCPGERMDELLETIVRRVCAIRQWELDGGVRQLGKNWQQFVLGRCT